MSKTIDIAWYGVYSWKRNKCRIILSTRERAEAWIKRATVFTEDYEIVELRGSLKVKSQKARKIKKEARTSEWKKGE